MNDKTTLVNSGDLLMMVSLVVGENKDGGGITVDVEEGEGEHGVMVDLTPPYDGQLIQGGLVGQGMKVLLEVLHGEFISFFYSTLPFFFAKLSTSDVLPVFRLPLLFFFLKTTIEITFLSLFCVNALTSSQYTC